MNDFSIPLGRTPAAHLSAVFSSPTFKKYELPSEPLETLSSDDVVWVQETVAQGQKMSPAPSPAAERYLRTAFREYDFAMPVTKQQWQNYVMDQWYRMSKDPDPKVAKSALDSLAKSSVVGLMVEQKEININTKSTVELEEELLRLVGNVLNRRDEKVINA